MAFDAGFTRAVAAELDALLAGAKVEKVTEPSRDEIIIQCYKAGATRRLFASANPARSRICLTESVYENPKVSPMFCMLLRKHLSGATIKSIRQQGFERVIEVEFSAYDDMSFATSRTLVVEIMGKCSNIMFLDEKRKILGVLRAVDFTTSAKRQVLPGMIYEAPPAQENKFLPTEESRERFLERLSVAEKSRKAEDFLLGTYIGLSPLISREIAFSVGMYGKDVSECDGEALYSAFAEYVESIDRAPTPTLIYDGEAPVEYSFTDIKQYGERKKEHFGMLWEMLDAFYSEKDKIAIIKAKTHDVLKTVQNAKARLSKKAVYIKRDLKECEEAEKFKLWGDLITSSLYMLTGKSASCEVVNFYSEELEKVRIPLDIKLSASQNAAKYFKKYTKLKKAKEILTEQLVSAEKEEKYLDSVETAIALSENESDVSQIKAELTAAGYIARTAQNGKKPQKKEQIVPLKFTSPGGRTVYCGKNNVQNDFITTKLGKKSDWWFHVKNKPGSHVLLVCEEGEDPDASEFTFAAQVAAYYSSLRGGENVAVDYTLLRNVKKPAGASAGHVVYYTNYTAYVDPRIS